MKKTLLKVLPIFFIIIFVFLRLYNAQFLPPFIDELLYIRWIKEIANNGNWLISLTEDGQPPLFFWLISIFSHFFTDKLLLLRVFSSLFGGISILLGYRVVRMITDSYIAPLMYLFISIFSPFFLMYDRLGMRESVITACFTLVIYGLVSRLIKNDAGGAVFIAWGIFLGLMIKSTALLFIPVVVLSYIFFQKKLVKADWYVFVSIVIPFLIFTATGTLSNVLGKNSIFLFDPQELIKYLRLNVYSFYTWINYYIGIGLFAIFVIVSLIEFRKKSFLTLMLLITLPILIFEILFAKIFFPRYFLFTAQAVFIALAYILSRTKTVYEILLLCLAIPMVVNTAKIAINLPSAELPAVEDWQYISGWPSGYGLEELSSYLNQVQPKLILVESNDLARTGISYYGVDLPYKIFNSQQELSDLVVSNQSAMVITNTHDNWAIINNLNLVESIARPHNGSPIRVYRP